MKTVTATHAEHRAACMAWHGNRRRIAGLSTRHAEIIRAIDAGTFKFRDPSIRLSNLENRLARSLS